MESYGFCLLQEEIECSITMKWNKRDIKTHYNKSPSETPKSNQNTIACQHFPELLFN